MTQVPWTGASQGGYADVMKALLLLAILSAAASARTWEDPEPATATDAWMIRLFRLAASDPAGRDGPGWAALGSRPVGSLDARLRTEAGATVQLIHANMLLDESIELERDTDRHLARLAREHEDVQRLVAGGMTLCQAYAALPSGRWEDPAPLLQAMHAGLAARVAAALPGDEAAEYLRESKPGSLASAWTASARYRRSVADAEEDMPEAPRPPRRLAARERSLPLPLPAPLLRLPFHRPAVAR